MRPSEIVSSIERAELPDAQRANAIDLLNAIADDPSPTGLSINPYDGGVSLHWERIEIAMFEDRFETYQFLEGDTVIHHWARSPGQRIDGQMLAELRAAID